ncbi:transcriptional regulator swi6 [Podochytrium sp. JEL0797]|nr:transcriptional regulator swi6 [Podochytrium sp. JEL0797]
MHNAAQAPADTPRDTASAPRSRTASVISISSDEGDAGAGDTGDFDEAFLDSAVGNLPPPQTPFAAPPVPVIYGAVYSGIPVFEMMCNGTALMRRRSDSYLNLTQILKVVCFDKNKRAAVLDAVANADRQCEKIQGGYGKYQGTWLPMPRALQIATRFHAAAILKPLIEFQPPRQQTTPVISTITPSGNAPRIQTSNIVLQQRQQQQQRQAATATQPARQQQQPQPPPPAKATPPLPAKQRPKRGARPRDFIEEDSSEESDFESDASATSSEEDANPSTTTAANTTASVPASTSSRPATRTTKRLRTTVEDSDPDEVASTHSTATPHPGASTQHLLHHLSPAQHLIEKQRQILLAIFTTPGDRTSVPDFLVTPSPASTAAPKDLQIDDAGHTCLHWAATLARVPLVEALIKSNTCTATFVNHLGESALIRAVLSANNSDAQSFRKLVKALGPKCLILRDAKQRTALHHACLGFGVRGHATAARYYLESLCQFLKQNSGLEGIKGLLDARDGNGDTAVNVAARLGARTAVEVLVEAGADCGVRNLAGLRPVDFGMEDLVGRKGKGVMGGKGVGTGGGGVVEPVVVPVGVLGAESDALLKKANEMTQEIQTLLQTLTSSFSTEILSHQTRLTSHTTTLDTLTKELAHLSRVNQTLRNQIARFPDLAVKLHAVEATLKEEVEKKAEAAREAMERDLRNAVGVEEGGVEKLEGGGDTEMQEGGQPTSSDNAATAAVAAATQPTATDSESERKQTLANQIRVLETHLTKKERDNAQVQHDLAALRAEDAVTESNYRKIIGMCCQLELEQIDANMLGVLLAAVESDDSGAGEGAGSSGAGVASVNGGGGGVEEGNAGHPMMMDESALSTNEMLDGLLFKATSLSSV